jgi:hypothetical protein
LPTHKANAKNAKELPSQRTKINNMIGQTATEKEQRRHNITYTQAGVSCFVRKESGKFKVQFFVGSSVVKSLPAYS